MRRARSIDGGVTHEARQRHRVSSSTGRVPLERRIDPSVPVDAARLGHEHRPIQARVDGINDQIRLNDQRVEDLDELLEAKRARLEAEFVAMERILAQLQNQNAALGSIRPLVVSRSTSSGQAGTGVSSSGIF